MSRKRYTPEQIISMLREAKDDPNHFSQPALCVTGSKRFIMDSKNSIPKN